MTDLLDRLRRVENGDGKGDHVSHWYRNPDGPEAAAEIERLQRSATDWRLEADVHRKRAAAAVAEIARLRLTATGKDI